MTLVSGILLQASGQPAVGAVLTLVPHPKVLQAGIDQAQVPSAILATADGTGLVTFNALPGRYVGTAQLGVEIWPLSLIVPVTSPAALKSCLEAGGYEVTPVSVAAAQAAAAAAAVSAAAAAATLANAVTLDGTQTVTGSKTFPDNATFFADTTDPTKKVRLKASGVPTNTTVVLTTPGQNGTLALDKLATATASGLVPASGGGTANFLRSDLSWAAPPGGGGVTDGDKGDVIVSGSGAIWALDYPAVNAAIAPTWALISGKPTVLSATTASYTTGEQIKLAAIAAGATANAADAFLLTRTNHTGLQLAATLSDFAAAADARVAAGITGKQDMSAKGAANGYAGLDGSAKVPTAQLPTTDGITEGTTNLYATNARSIGSVLTGFAAAGARTAVVATDTLLAAWGKAQRYFNDLSAVAFTGAWSDLSGKPTTAAGLGLTDTVLLTGAQAVAGKKSFGSEIGHTGLATDPGAPVNGDIWYNATDNRLKSRSNGLSVVLDGPQNIPWLTPASGDYMMTTMGSGSATGVLAGVADRIDLFPFTARADNAITGLACYVTTAVAGAVGKIILYDSDTNGRPNALIVETADLDFSTTGAKTGTVAQTLRQGKTYWVGLRHNSTASYSVWPAAGTPDINGGSPNISSRKILRRSLTYATAAPSSWGWTVSEINNNTLAPAIWLKV